MCFFYDYLYYQLNTFSKEEIIGKIITLNSHKAIDSKGNHKKSTIKNQPIKTDNTMSKLRINIGRSDKLTPEMLIKLINKTIRSRDTKIGKINISKNYATFEIESNMKKNAISKMKQIRHYRKNLKVTDFSEDFQEITFNKRRKKNKRKRRFS